MKYLMIAVVAAANFLGTANAEGWCLTRKSQDESKTEIMKIESVVSDDVFETPKPIPPDYKIRRILIVEDQNHGCIKSENCYVELKDTLEITDDLSRKPDLTRFRNDENGVQRIMDQVSGLKLGSENRFLYGSSRDKNTKYYLFYTGERRCPTHMGHGNCKTFRFEIFPYHKNSEFDPMKPGNKISWEKCNRLDPAIAPRFLKPRQPGGGGGVVPPP